MNDDFVFSGEEPLILEQPPQNCELRFYNNENEKVGRLYWDDKLKFEGNAEESAKIFIKWLKELWV